MMVQGNEHRFDFTRDDMTTSLSYLHTINAMDGIFYKSNQSDFTPTSHISSLHQAAQQYMLQSYEIPTRFRSDSVVSTNSFATSLMSDRTLSSSYSNSEFDFGSKFNLSKRASCQTDTITLNDQTPFPRHTQSSVKVAKIFGIQSNSSSLPKPRKSKYHTKFMHSIFQSKLSKLKLNKPIGMTEFTVSLSELSGQIYGWVELLIPSKTKSIFRPYRWNYLALNKNIIYKFNDCDPTAISTDEFPLSSLSQIHLPHHPSSKSDRWEMELTNPNLTWTLRFPAQAILLQWLDALSIAQDRISQSSIHLPTSNSTASKSHSLLLPTPSTNSLCSPLNLISP